MKSLTRILISILTLAITTELSGTGQARAEQPEIPLPVLESRAWALLADVGLREYETAEGIWLFEKTFAPELEDAARAPFRITGYIVPVTTELWQETILLVSNTLDCPFCGSSGYGTALEVGLARPVRDVIEFDKVEITGQLVLVDDPDTMQSVRIEKGILRPAE